jgi:hypothetical protein
MAEQRSEQRWPFTQGSAEKREKNGEVRAAESVPMNGMHVPPSTCMYACAPIHMHACPCTCMHVTPPWRMWAMLHVPAPHASYACRRMCLVPNHACAHVPMLPQACMCACAHASPSTHVCMRPMRPSMHACMCPCPRVCLYVRMCPCSQVCICACVHVPMHISKPTRRMYVCVCVRESMYACVHACMCACYVCVFVCACMHRYYV